MEAFLKIATFVIILISSSLILTSANTNYCNRALCRGKRHIACNNSGSFDPICSSNAEVIPITADLRNLIVRTHNRYRAQVARGGLSRYKSARRMATMRWGSELAKVAAYNVKQCIMKHDDCRNTRNFRYAGQNLAQTIWVGYNASVEDVVLRHMQVWFDEHKLASMQIINSYGNVNSRSDIGHFTQMVQERASFVGCAILRQSYGTAQFQFTACNYAFTNVYNQPVYRSGRTASGCKTGRNPQFKSLCSRRERYKVNSLTY